jgi:hypothetical protein
MTIQFFLASALAVVVLTILGMSYAARKCRNMHAASELMERDSPYS